MWFCMSDQLFIARFWIHPSGVLTVTLPTWLVPHETAAAFGVQDTIQPCTMLLHAKVTSAGSLWAPYCDTAAERVNLQYFCYAALATTALPVNPWSVQSFQCRIFKSLGFVRNRHFHDTDEMKETAPEPEGLVSNWNAKGTLKHFKGLSFISSSTHLNNGISSQNDETKHLEEKRKRDQNTAQKVKNNFF